MAYKAATTVFNHKLIPHLKAENYYTLIKKKKPVKRNIAIMFEMVIKNAFES